jgi:transketolase
MPKATRAAFGDALKRLGETHDRIVVLDADLSCSTMTRKFADAFPDRFFQLGIAEGNMVGVAAGLALGGYVPFAASFACFITGRFEQIRMSVGYNNANVRIVGTHAGCGIGEDGYSQMGLEDIAVMRSLPNMIVIQPADAVEAERATEFLADYMGPAYLRLTRQPLPDLYDASYRFDFGQGVVMRDGADLTIVATGGTVCFAIEAAKALSREGIDAGVVNMHTLKPIDAGLLRKLASRTGRVMTVEDHGVVGGLGSAVLEALADVPNVVVHVHGVRSYGESGTHEDLFARHRLDAAGIAAVVKEVFGPGKRAKAAS